MLSAAGMAFAVGLFNRIVVMMACDFVSKGGEAVSGLTFYICRSPFDGLYCYGHS